MALGIDLARHAKDVRRLTLARRKGPALALDPDDLVHEVCRRILRRNRQACAWDPSRGSLGHYVYQVAGNAIADMLAAQRRVARWELRADPEREDEVAAPEPDTDAVPFDLEGAPLDADEREDAFRAAVVLHLVGELPEAEPLWARALRQRREERQASLFGASALAAPEPAEPPPPPAPAPRPRAPRSVPGPVQGSLF